MFFFCMKQESHIFALYICPYFKKRTNISFHLLKINATDTPCPIDVYWMSILRWYNEKKISMTFHVVPFDVFFMLFQWAKNRCRFDVIFLI